MGKFLGRLVHFWSFLSFWRLGRCLGQQTKARDKMLNGLGMFMGALFGTLVKWTKAWVRTPVGLGTTFCALASNLVL